MTSRTASAYTVFQLLFDPIVYVNTGVLQGNLVPKNLNLQRR